MTIAQCIERILRFDNVEFCRLQTIMLGMLKMAPT